MSSSAKQDDDWPVEKQEWLDSLWSVYRNHGIDHVAELLALLQERALKAGLDVTPSTLNTPYRNTIPADKQPPYPGDIETIIIENEDHVVYWNYPNSGAFAELRIVTIPEVA